MRRTEWLQETRKMRFEEAYEGWQARRASGAVKRLIHRPGVSIAHLFPGGHFLGQDVGVGEAAVGDRDLAVPGQRCDWRLASFLHLDYPSNS